MLNLYRKIKEKGLIDIYLVYKHTNKINNKIYIGITSRTAQERWGHNGNNYSTSPHFFSAVHKYGWDNFEHEILFEELTKEEACAKEKELIKEYKANDRRFGYNQTDGGEYFEANEDVRRRISLAMMGNKNGLGKPCSEEKKRKISEAQKGKIVSEETRRRQSESAKRRKHNGCSEEVKEKLRNSYPKMRKVYCIETDTVYKSVQECARQLELNASYVSAVCRGKYKTAKGFHLKYYD